jgi:hypothetical protein
VPVGQIDPLAHSAFKSEIAGVLEYHGAVTLKVLDVFNPAPCTPQELG